MNKPIISLIAAMAKNRVIGKDNKMPWHLPADLKHFKSVTMSKPIVMGRKTFESIGKPLAGRENVIISKNIDYFADGCIVVHSIEDALTLLADYKEIMVIGGGFLYSQIIDQADKLYLTYIDLEIDGDTCFPEFKHLNPTEICRTKCVRDDNNPYDYQFVDYQVHQ
jgi:dihydrofolate reductase